MKISTCLAVALLSLSSMSAFAQDAESDLKGELKFENALDAYGKTSAPSSTPMVMTSEGNIIVTGTEYPNASSYYPGAFVALSTKEFPATPIWKMIFNGSSIITAAVADDNGGVYVGGNFRNTLTLPVDGDITLEGAESYGEKKSAFIAHINKDGKVVAAKAINSTANAEMVAKYPNSYDSDAAFCNLNSLAFVDGKLYAGLTFSNTLSYADGAKTLSSSTFDGSDPNVGLGVGSTTAYAVALCDISTMGISSIPVVFDGDGSEADKTYWGLDVPSAKFAIDGSNVYLVASVNGFTPKGALWVSGQKLDTPSFTYNQGDINDYYVAKINLNTNKVNSKVFDGNYTYTNVDNETGIGEIEIIDNNLWVAGCFRQNLPFKPSITAVGNTDTFVAALDKENFSVVNVLTSSFDETTSGTNNQEYLSAFCVTGKQIAISGYVGKAIEYADYIIDKVSPLLFNVDDYTTETKLENDADTNDDYITGTLINDKVVYFAFLTNNLFSYYYGYGDVENPTDGISTIDATSLSKDAVIYNLQGMKLRAPQKGLNIVNGKKVVIK